MRVVIVTESFLPTVSGVTTSVCKVLEQLRAGGHNALLIAPAGAPLQYAGFPVVTVPSVNYREFPLGLPSPKVHTTIAGFEPDVVHVASPFMLGAHATASANRLGIPVVAIFQTDVAGYARHNRMRGATVAAWRYLRWVHAGADLTLAPSSATIQQLRTNGMNRLAIWGRGVDNVAYRPSRRNDPDSQELRRQLAPHGETVAVSVCRLAPEKQVERLRVLRGIAGLSIAIVGDGPSSASVRHALSGLNTHFLGRLGGAQLSAAYAAGDIFVHTGTEETFGQTLQEAAASGLPVVAPRAGGPIDIVEHGRTGLLYAPTNDQDLRRSIQALVSDASTRARFGEAGRRSVLGRGWPQLCAELFEHYESVIDARAEQRRLTSVPERLST